MKGIVFDYEDIVVLLKIKEDKCVKPILLGVGKVGVLTTMFCPRGKPLVHYSVETVGISRHYLGNGNITKNK